MKSKKLGYGLILIGLMGGCEREPVAVSDGSPAEAEVESQESVDGISSEMEDVIHPEAGVQMHGGKGGAERKGRGIPATRMKKLGAAPRATGPGPRSWIGKAIPEFTMKVTDGSEITSTSIRGKVVLVDFWASWCGPCKALSPVLQRLHENYSDQGLLIVGANVSERDAERNVTSTPDIAVEYARKHSFTYTFTYGADELKETFGVTGLPTMVLVDREGVVQDVVVGFDKSMESILTEKIEPLLEK